jgi:hypothetical protein
LEEFLVSRRLESEKNLERIYLQRRYSLSQRRTQRAGTVSQIRDFPGYFPGFSASDFPGISASDFPGYFPGFSASVFPGYLWFASIADPGYSFFVTTGT